MRMPPSPADFIHARACKLKCEKILTRPKNRKDRVEICGEFDIIYQNKYVLDSRNLQVIYKGGVTDSRIFRMYKTMRR